MFYFFDFLYEELCTLDGLILDDKIGMLPCVYYNDKGIENIVIDYNFLVKVAGRFIEKYNLGDGNKFIQDFKVEVVRGNPNARARKLLFTHTIFELYWKCAYINFKKICLSKVSQAKQVAFVTSSRIKEIVNCYDLKLVDKWLESHNIVEI